VPGFRAKGASLRSNPAAVATELERMGLHGDQRTLNNVPITALHEAQQGRLVHAAALGAPVRQDVYETQLAKLTPMKRFRALYPNMKLLESLQKRATEKIFAQYGPDFVRLSRAINVLTPPTDATDAPEEDDAILDDNTMLSVINALLFPYFGPRYIGISLNGSVASLRDKLNSLLGDMAKIPVGDAFDRAVAQALEQLYQTDPASLATQTTFTADMYTSPLVLDLPKDAPFGKIEVMVTAPFIERNAFNVNQDSTLRVNLEIKSGREKQVRDYLVKWLTPQNPREQRIANLVRHGYQRQGNFVFDISGQCLLVREDASMIQFEVMDMSESETQDEISRITSSDTPLEEQLIAAGYVKVGDGEYHHKPKLFKLGSVILTADGKITHLLQLPSTYGYGYGLSVTLPDTLIETEVLTRELTQQEIREILINNSQAPMLHPIVEPSGFQIGGTNSTETIRNLTSINGISIQELEDRMRPGNHSEIGFLGRKERLLKVMAQDNEVVLAHGLTHQDIAQVLEYIMAVSFNLTNETLTFPFQGHTYSVKLRVWSGSQDSPFGDKHLSSRDIIVKNLETDEKFSFSELLPPLISRYGFYEGGGTENSYRLDPAKLIRFFDLSKKTVGQQIGQ
jgi:hypothetical protein